MTENTPRAFGLALLFALAPPLHADAQAPAATPPAAEGERVMLPAFVTPQHYRIDITPDADASIFKGTVQIDVTVNRPTDKIVLNSADIVIDRAAVSGGTAVAAIRYDEAVQTATLTLGREIKPGAYTLSLAYHGKIYPQASGLFALDYRTAKGKARALFTQFENSDARRFVPSLGRACPQGDLRADRHRAGGPDGRLQHAGRIHGGACQAPEASALRRDTQDVVLSSVLRARRFRARAARLVDGVDVGIVVKRGDTASTAFALDARPRACCPTTTAISRRLIRCPSWISSPARAPASSSAPWRTGARSSPSKATC